MFPLIKKSIPEPDDVQTIFDTSILQLYNP